MTSVLAILVAAALVAAPQQGQSGGTAADLRAQRDAKRSNLEQPTLGTVEKGLAWLEEGHWLEKLRAGWHGFLPTLGGFPSGSGQAFGVIGTKTGVGVRYPNEFTPNRLDFRVSGAMSLRGYSLALGEVSLRRIAGTPVHASVHLGYQRNREESFYGPGLDSALEDRTNYLIEVGAAGAAVWWNAPSWLYIGGGINYRDVNVGRGTHGDFPSTEEVFDPSAAPGIDRQPAFITTDGFIQVDWRNQGKPYRGGLYAIRWSDWHDQDFDSFTFGDLDIELQQYIPFLSAKRVIALRARTILSEPRDASQQVPFYLWPTLGGNKDLRGFRYARLTDRNAISLTAEYRAEVWLALDLALFIDAGKVFEDRSDFSFDDLETNYGFGARFKTTQSTFIRADIAFGGEGTQFYFVFEDVFDSTPLFSRILQTVQ